MELLGVFDNSQEGLSSAFVIAGSGATVQPTSNTKLAQSRLLAVGLRYFETQRGSVSTTNANQTAKAKS